MYSNNLLCLLFNKNRLNKFTNLAYYHYLVLYSQTIRNIHAIIIILNVLFTTCLAPFHFPIILITALSCSNFATWIYSNRFHLRTLRKLKVSSQFYLHPCSLKTLLLYTLSLIENLFRSIMLDPFWVSQPDFP